VHHPVAQKANPRDAFLDMSWDLLTASGMREHLAEQRAVIGKPEPLREWAVEETIPESKVQFRYDAIRIVGFVVLREAVSR
jgi:hypothetical protein